MISNSKTEMVKIMVNTLEIWQKIYPLFYILPGLYVTNVELNVLLRFRLTVTSVIDIHREVPEKNSVEKISF